MMRAKALLKKIVDSKPVTVLTMLVVALIVGPEVFVAMEITAVIELIGASGFVTAVASYYMNCPTVVWIKRVLFRHSDKKQKTDIILALPAPAKALPSPDR